MCAQGTTHNPCYTDSVLRNLTLTVDEDVLRAARKAALDRNTSVNQLVRDYLAQLLGEEDRRRAALDDLAEIFRTTRIRVGSRKWAREDLHER
jgi:hypothetical protein